jgi:hypothetical protein
MWYGVVAFHRIAARQNYHTMSTNFQAVAPYLATPLGLVALFGSVTALLRKDWRVLPLLAWLLASIILLVRQNPLFPHHMIAVEPPVITLAVLGAANAATYKNAAWIDRLKTVQLAKWLQVAGLILVLVAAFLNINQEYGLLVGADNEVNSPTTQQNLIAAADLRQAITSDQWVVTDGQFVAGLADRSTPPQLVDTSWVHLGTGSITLMELESITAEPQVHAVLFYTGRLNRTFNGYKTWLSLSFKLVKDYGSGKQLWVKAA